MQAQSRGRSSSARSVFTEELECRILLSWTMQDGVLFITGTDADDVLIQTTATPSGTKGWLYNKTDGSFLVNSAGLVKSDTTGTLHYNEL